MATKLEQSLDDCLEQLKKGKTIEDCLRLYPDMKKELKPYLETAFEIKENVPVVSPSEAYKLALKERLLATIGREVVTKPAVPRCILWSPRLYPRIALAILIICGILFGSVYASAKSLPDSPLYPLKKAVENTQIFLTLDSLDKASLHLKFAQRRINEAEAMIEKNKSNAVKKVLAEYKDQLAKSLAKAREAKKKGKNTEEVYEKVSEATLKHQEVLSEIYEKVPEQAKPAIEKAIEKSIKGHEEALKAISGEKREEMKKKEEEMKKKVEKRIKKKLQAIPKECIDCHTNCIKQCEGKCTKENKEECATCFKDCHKNCKDICKNHEKPFEEMQKWQKWYEIQPTRIFK
jgi:hypothetical protein